MRKTLLFIVLGFLALLLIILFNGCGTYNEMVKMEEGVNAQWQQVENQYQRRSDLIPNLVSVVRNYADFEKSTLQAVTDARANATRINIDPTRLDEESMRKFQEAQAAVSSSLGRLLAVAENYPNLKANQNFLELQAQLEGTENRITTERMRFNEMTRDYNAYIRRFPKNIWAGIFNFDKKAYFESEAGAEKAPDVDSLFKK